MELVVKFKLQLLYNQGKRPQYPFLIGSWVANRSSLGEVVKRKIAACAGN
jgi:hypothetical protein